MTPFRSLLIRSLAVLAVTVGLVAVCYFWVDRPAAEFVTARGISRSDVLREVTDFPMLLNALAPVVALYAVVKLAFAPLGKFDRAALAAAVSLMIAIAFEWYLKYLAGRYWPDTWLKPPNPSFLGTGDYGFHPFHSEREYGSFPSGHTLRTAAVFVVFALAYPRSRWLCAAVVLLVMIALVGMNYHFVGDTVGGAAVGYFTAIYTWAFMARPEKSAAD